MSRHLAVILLVLAGATSLFASSTVASVASTTQADLCLGQVPTIIGAPGEFLQGTEGPDVVVTNGASGANTLGGDDLLCVRQQPDGSSVTDFRTGTGSDRLDASRASGGFFFLGPGVIEPGLGAADLALLRRLDDASKLPATSRTRVAPSGPQRSGVFERLGLHFSRRSLQCLRHQGVHGRGGRDRVLP
jgi:hypothetical protein